MKPLPPSHSAAGWADIVDQHARDFPDRDALVLREHRLSYQDLSQRVDEACRLLTRHGIQRGDRVALLSPPRPEAVITFLACARIGAVWLSLNPKYKAPEIDYIINHAKPRLILSVIEFDGTRYDAALQRSIAKLQIDSDAAAALVWFDGHDATHHSLFKALSETAPHTAAPGNMESAAPRLDSPCMLVYTSGTTGQPKGVLLPQAASIFRASVQAEYFKTSEPPRILNFSTINHVGGMQFRTLTQLYAGGTVFFQERFKPEETLQLLRRHKINMLMLGPTMLHMLMQDESFDVDIFQQLEWYVSAGAALPVPALKKLAQHCPQVASVYGSTESCSTVSYASLKDSFDSVAYTIGWSIPQGQMRVADKDGNALGPHEEGELQIRKEHCMAGYLNNDEATRQAFTADGWYRTGDLAVMLPDNSFKISGRIKEMFKSGGYNVYPREVELALEAHPAVRMAAVVSVDDPVFQQVGHAFVLLDSGANTDISEQDIVGWCKARLANYKVPKRIFLRDELPMLAIGKVNKVRLKEEASHHTTRETMAG